MNFKLLHSLIISLSVALAAPTLSAYMTDEQVVEYAKSAAAQGKSKKQIGTELLAKGVTEEQARRIQASYGLGGSGGDAEAKAAVSGNIGNSDRYSTNNFERNVIEEVRPSTDEANVRAAGGKSVFGRSLFNTRNLTFEPNENLATPEDYKLGPGDEVIIDIWGNNEDHIRQTISAEGRIFVSQIGPIYLNGLSIAKANKVIKDMFASKYADVASEGSDISLTLGNMRTIQIDIMGEVATPGTYRISPFSTLFHALYNAGGPSGSGTLRGIEVVRNGKKVAISDIYDYLFNGKHSNDIRLRESDVIVVPAYERLVEIVGEVKRPTIYELKSDETLEDLIKYAGGTTASAYVDRLTIDRIVNGAKTVAVIEAGEFSKTTLEDGDVVHIGSAIDRYDNRVEIGGAVFRPGYYAINDGVRTVKDLITIANGLKEDAFLNRAQIFRETEDKQIKIIPVALGEILNGTAADIELQSNDVLMVASKNDIEDRGDITIAGAVHNPGNYAYAEGMTLEDLIFQAGGLTHGASTSTVDISRRITDPRATTIGENISQTFKISIKDGLVIDGDENFILQPYDVVDIRRSPGYITQRRVSISGEVPFEGSYTLTRRSERISDLVERAGGVSDFAYLRGASLRRNMTQEEMNARNEIIRLARASGGNDSIAAGKLLTTTTYSVGIELDKALANPGGEDDLVLQPGDHLFVPELINTVKISGEVLFPNTVIYKPGQKLKYYIEQAGGYASMANKGKAFVVYMNGHVSKGKGSKIEPGCHIIVPSKQKGKGLSLAEWLSIATTAASLGTMAASITNLIK